MMVQLTLEAGVKHQIPHLKKFFSMITPLDIETGQRSNLTFAKGSQAMII